MPPAVRELVENLSAKVGMSEVAQLEDKRAASSLEYEERRQKAIEAFLQPEEPKGQKAITSIEMLKERLIGELNDQNA